MLSASLNKTFPSFLLPFIPETFFFFFFIQKLLQNVRDNKTRAQIVLQKHAELQNVSSESTSSQASRVMTELSNLEQAALETCDTLRDAIEEQEKYESEIQQLNAAMNDAQERLLASPVMATSVEALKKQIAEHDVRTLWLAGRAVGG